MIKREQDFYSHVSEQYYYPNPKPYQKRKVNGQMTFDDVDDEYRKAIAEERRKNESYAKKLKSHKQANKKWQSTTKSYTKEELENIFWDKLVNLGWRFDDNRFVLICVKCDTLISEIAFDNMTPMAVTNMSDTKIIKHKTSNHICNEDWVPKTKP